MTFPTTFATLTAGNQPASLFDTMFNIVGAQGAIPCSATGTNTYSLTPQTNYYQPASYGAPGASFQMVAWVVPNSSTGAVTARLGSLAFINVYMPSGLQAGSGDLTVNTFVIMAFNPALNAGAGGFQVFNATTPSVIQPVQGVTKNLQIVNSVGTPDTIITLTADEVMLENVSGGTAKVSNITLNINTTTTGANGLDTGAMAANTFYSVWVIFNAAGPTTAGLISLSATAPTLPSGFTYKARVGWVKTGAASTNLNRILQKGRRAQYVVTASSQTTSLPNIATGITGTYSGTSPTLAAVSITGVVPSTAGEIIFLVNPQYKNGTSANVLVAPNVSYGGTNNGPIGSNGMVYPVWMFATGTALSVGTYTILLETTTIAIAADAAGFACACLGWIDNL